MEQKRTEKVSIMITAAERERLRRFAERNVWSVSTAAQVLIAEGLEREASQGEAN